MFSDRPILTFVLISLAVHGVILSQSPDLVFFSKAHPKKMEVNYVKIPKLEPKQSPAQYKKLPQSKKEEAPRSLPRVLPKASAGLGKSGGPPSFIDNQPIFKKDRIITGRQTVFMKPDLAKPDTISIRKKVSLPPIDFEKANNPSYISYYQIVREKIRRAAYQNYTRTEMGEVFLSFVVSDQGYVREVRIVDEKSSDSLFLREIALLSVREASPFPVFPKDLDYPQLSFNVIVSFEVE